jgi:hypothetical protein
VLLLKILRFVIAMQRSSCNAQYVRLFSLPFSVSLEREGEGGKEGKRERGKEGKDSLQYVILKEESLATYYFKLSGNQKFAHSQFADGFLLGNGDGIPMNKSLAENVSNDL